MFETNNVSQFDPLGGLGKPAQGSKKEANDPFQFESTTFVGHAEKQPAQKQPRKQRAVPSIADIVNIFAKYDRGKSGSVTKEDAQKAMFENSGRLGLSQKDVALLSKDSAIVASDGKGKVLTQTFAMYISFELMKKARDPAFGEELALAREQGDDNYKRPSPRRNASPFAFGEGMGLQKQNSAPNLYGSSANDAYNPFDNLAPLQTSNNSGRANKRVKRSQSAFHVQAPKSAGASDPFKQFLKGKPEQKESEEFMATLYDQVYDAIQSPRGDSVDYGDAVGVPVPASLNPASSGSPPAAGSPFDDDFEEKQAPQSNENATQWDPFANAAPDADATAAQSSDPNPFDQPVAFGLQSISEDNAVSHPAKAKPKKREKKESGGEGASSDDDSDGSSSSSSSSNAEKKQKKDSGPSPPQARGKDAVKDRRHTNALYEMRRGTAMLKYGRRGFPHFRRFQISKDNSRFQWYSRKKSLSNTSIQIKEIHEIAQGQTTDIFKKCKQMALAKASFSVIYGGKRQSLDVVAKSPDEAKMWVTGLRKLVEQHKAGKDLADVDYVDAGVIFKDITRPGYSVSRLEDRRKRRSQSVQVMRSVPDVTMRGDGDEGPPRENNKPLRKAIEKDVVKIKKLYERLLSKSRNPKILASIEFKNIATLLSEMEQRIEDCENILNDRALDITVVKRDVWILKVDIKALEDFVMVISS